MTAVFLDLDGTLMDSRVGILSSLSHAFRAVGRHDLAEQDMTWIIGPPFHDTFPKLGIENVEETIGHYRDHYQAGGMYDAQVYDGIIGALDTLMANGARLYLATAKPHVYARKITAHFGIADRMTQEFGPEIDGTRNWKGDLLAHALELTGEAAENAVMVGDRYHDMGAAEFVGMRSIAVRWGYGTEEDWKGAAALIDHPSELPETVASLDLGR